MGAAGAPRGLAGADGEAEAVGGEEGEAGKVAVVGRAWEGGARVAGVAVMVGSAQGAAVRGQPVAGTQELERVEVVLGRHQGVLR